jgi:hypothetical protein
VLVNRFERQRTGGEGDLAGRAMREDDVPRRTRNGQLASDLATL